MKIHVSFSTPEAQNAVLQSDNSKTLMAALASANAQLADHKTSGAFTDADGNEMGTWALEITAEDLRAGSAASTTVENKTDQGELREAASELGSSYVQYVLREFDGENKYRVLSSLNDEHPGNIDWDGTDSQLRKSVRAIAEMDAEAGPKHYTFREQFRTHLLMSYLLPNNADELFNFEFRYR